MKEFFWQISVWIVLLPLLTGLLGMGKLQRDSKIVFAIVLLATLPQLFSFFPLSKPVKYTSYNLYTPLEFLLLYGLFMGKFTNNAFKKWLHLSCVLYFVACALLFYNEGIQKRFINELVCLNNLIYLIWMLLYMRKQFLQPDEPFTVTSSFFWYFNGILLYAPCTLVVFALYHYLRTHKDSVLQNLWIIHSICNILMYVLFAYGLFQDIKFRKQQLASQL